MQSCSPCSQLPAALMCAWFLAERSEFCSYLAARPCDGRREADAMKATLDFITIQAAGGILVCSISKNHSVKHPCQVHAELLRPWSLAHKTSENAESCLGWGLLEAELQWGVLLKGLLLEALGSMRWGNRLGKGRGWASFI